MKAIVTTAILCEVMHPKLIFAKCLQSCISVSVWETFLFTLWFHQLLQRETPQSTLCRSTQKLMDSQCRGIVQDPPAPSSPKPKTHKRLRLLEFMLFLLWLSLWKRKKRHVQLKTTLKRERGGCKYAPKMFWRIEITHFLWAVCNKFSLGISYQNYLFLLSNIKNTVTLLTNVSFLCVDAIWDA